MLSETEIEICSFYLSILLGGFGFQVDGISLYVNGFDGADEFASAATYAQLGIGLGDGKATLERNHVNGLDGTVLGAGSATGAVYVNHTDVYVEYHAARLCAVFLLYCKGLDGACRTDLAAKVAVIVAVTLVKLHYRLHYACQSVFHACGFEYVTGALAYAEVACCTMLKQVPVAD